MNENEGKEAMTPDVQGQAETPKADASPDTSSCLARRCWKNGQPWKTLFFVVSVLLVALLVASCGRCGGKAEIDFVKRSPFKGTDSVPIGAAIELNASGVEWRLGQSALGAKFVEVTGTLKDNGKQNAIKVFGSGDNTAFYKAIPAVHQLLWEGTQNKWSIDYWRTDRNRVKEFKKAVDKLESGEQVQWGSDKQADPEKTKQFKDAAKAMKKALKAEGKGDVRFTWQFPMPISNYDAEGNFNAETAVLKQDDCSFTFTEGPLAGQEFRSNFLWLVQ